MSISMKTTGLFAVLALGLIVGSNAQAREGHKKSAAPMQNKEGRMTAMQEGSKRTDAQQTRSVQRASDLLDMEVQNRQGKVIGQVEEVVLSDGGDQVEYLAISLDDDRELRLAVPLKKLSSSQGGRAVKLKASQSSIERQYARHSEDWPQTAGASRGQALSEEEAASRRVSELIGMNVQGSEGKKVGQIEDLLINMDDGKIKMATLSTGGFLGFNAKLTSIDWGSVGLHPEDGFATVNKTEERLQNEATGAQQYWQEFGFEGEDPPSRQQRQGGAGEQDQY